MLKQIKSDIPASTFTFHFKVAIGISDFICFKIKVTFIPSSCNV